MFFMDDGGSSKLLCDLENNVSDAGDGESLSFYAAVSEVGLRDSHNCTSAESSSCASQEQIPVTKECSMCGDVGIFKDLFRCKRCLYRYQHIYCSRSYPDLGPEQSVCNWCLQAEPKVESDGQGKPEKLKPKRAPERLPEVRAKVKRHSNAFEFLLQIAESLPEVGSDADEADRQTSSSRDTDISGGRIPKRQRCNHIADKSRVLGLDRWRRIAKSNLQLNPPRGMGRRYKLLADVLC